MREIKVVKNSLTGEIGARGIPDACARNEYVIAARFQDSCINTGSRVVTCIESLNDITEDVSILMGLDDLTDTPHAYLAVLRQYIANNWGLETLVRAVPLEKWRENYASRMEGR